MFCDGNFCFNNTFKPFGNVNQVIKSAGSHNGFAWGKLAEIAENYLQKGNKIAIEGKLIHRVYDDSDGQKCTSQKLWPTV